MLPGLGVIVCTQGATVAQRVRGLRLGADDWIAKPCHPEEVMARIEAVVRRHRRGQTREDLGPLVAGELEIMPDRFQAYVGGESLELTRREFELLDVLAEHAGKVLERDEIYQRVWGYAMIHGDRSVDVFVRKLRSKLQKRSPGWDYIHTHFGIGYRFDPQPLEPGADLLPDSEARRRGDAAEVRRGPRQRQARNFLEQPEPSSTGLPAPPLLARSCPGETFQGPGFTGFSQVGHSAVTGPTMAAGTLPRDQLDEGALRIDFTQVHTCHVRLRAAGHRCRRLRHRAAADPPLPPVARSPAPAARSSRR